MRMPVTLELLAQVVAPPAPPSVGKLHRWMRELRIGETSSSRKTLVSADEVAALTLYAWLRLGGLQRTVRIAEAKRTTLAALRALKRHEYVVVVAKLTSDGTELKVATRRLPKPASGTRLVPGDESLEFPLSTFRDEVRALMERGQLARLASTA